MSEKIKLKGQLKLPVVGRNPIFAQMKFVKVALSEPDILPDSGSIFTCDEQGNYDFEIYTGAHLLSYNVGNAWSKPIEIIADPLAEGLESIEISDLIGFQEIPELDATIAALNQQKQELLAIQQDVVLKQEAAQSSAEDAEYAKDSAINAINDTSFVHRYVFAASQVAGSGSNGMHTLVKLDEQSGGVYDFIEFPLINLSLSANAIVGSAAVIPLTQRITSLGARSCLYAQSGNGDVRVLYGKTAGEDTYNLYLASRSTQDNNASMTIFASTNKKMHNSSIVGAVTLTDWLAENTGVVELTKIQMGS